MKNKDLRYRRWRNLYNCERGLRDRHQRNRTASVRDAVGAEHKERRYGSRPVLSHGEDITYTASGTPSPNCAPSNPAGCLFISENDNVNVMVDSGFGGYTANLSKMNVWQ